MKLVRLSTTAKDWMFKAAILLPFYAVAALSFYAVYFSIRVYLEL